MINKILPDNPMIKGYEKRVPLNICENTVLKIMIKNISGNEKIVNPRQTGMFDKPNLNMGTGTGIKFSKTPMNADNPAIYAIFSLWVITIFPF